MRQVLVSSTFGAALLLASAAAQAGGGCYGSSCRPAPQPCKGSSCYNLVQTPPVYGTVAETYLARPARTQAQVIPAEYETVSEKVLIHPARQIPHHRPARYETVSEKVMISPGGKRWEVTTDAYGRTTGCWVYDKPRYGYSHRKVEVEPASVSYETIPAVYGERQRSVMTRPTQVVHHTIPAVYGTHHRKVMISPGGQHWARGGY
jgi:hypothetical protein